MLATIEPIGRFIALAHLEKGIIPQKSIEQNLDNVVDLIIARAKNQPIEDVANSLLEQVFELRLDLIQWFGKNDKNLRRFS